MKHKILSLALTLTLALGLFSACAPAASSSAAPSAPASVANSAKPDSTATAPSAAPAPKTDFKIASLKGPTTMGLVQLMDSADKGTARHNYNVTMYGTADEIAPQLIKGDIDVALVPCNLASVLYNKTEGAIQVAAVNTLGVLYLMEQGDTVHSVADLKGKTIYSVGKGTTPEYVLNYVLTKNGLTPGTDVTVEFKSEATEVVAMLQADTTGGAIALLPQPYATTVQMQSEKMRIALDMTQEWNAVSGGSNLVTGVVVARKDFIDKNAAAFDEFLSDYADSVTFVNSNTEEAAALIAGYEIVPKAPIAQKALPLCNITFVEGSAMKNDVSSYLQVLFDQNPASVGGKLPDDAFYYNA
ncbi:MAG: MqnA/MqnD/SBP family protein [Ruthenibacterium sp.]